MRQAKLPHCERRREKTSGIGRTAVVGAEGIDSESDNLAVVVLQVGKITYSRELVAFRDRHAVCPNDIDVRDRKHPSPIVTPGTVEDVQLARSKTLNTGLHPQRTQHGTPQRLSFVQERPW